MLCGEAILVTIKLTRENSHFLTLVFLKVNCDTKIKKLLINYDNLMNMCSHSPAFYHFPLFLLSMIDLCTKPFPSHEIAVVLLLLHFDVVCCRLATIPESNRRRKLDENVLT